MPASHGSGVMLVDGCTKSKLIEERNMNLLMAKVDIRSAKCDGCGREVYLVWDESHSRQFFTVCACGIVPQAWDF